MIPQPLPPHPPGIPIPMLAVIGVMVALAPRVRVPGIAVFRRVIEMRDGQHDGASGGGMRLTVFRAAIGILRAFLAAVSHAL